jgi:hypothetical protein
LRGVPEDVVEEIGEGEKEGVEFRMVNYCSLDE